MSRKGLSERKQQLPRWLLGAAIGLCTIIAYMPAIVSGGFIWDDDSYVTRNMRLAEEGGLRRIWWPDDPFQPRSADAKSLRFAKVWFKPATPQYYPVVFTTFWMEHKLWGYWPHGYHAVNVLLHAVNAMLLWLILARLKVPGAWLIAAVFALHPIHVESVAWITERKNTLSLMFYLLAAMAYLRFDRQRFGWADDDPDDAPAGAWGWYAAGLMLFVLALLSKSVTCSLPAALILVLIWLRVPMSLRRLLPLIPFFVIGFVLAMNTALIERELVGARGADFAHSFLDRTLIASRALLFYAEKHLWPHPLIFIYPRWNVDTAQLLQYLPLLLWCAVGAACLVALSRGIRGPFVALALFAGTVFPALGYFNVYPHIFSFVADHFVYHASIGFIALVIGGAVYLVQQRRSPLLSQLQKPAPSIAIALPLLLALGVLTFRQCMIYESEESVYRDTIAKNPAAWMPHNNLATLLIERAGEAQRSGAESSARALAEEAIQHAEAAIAVRSKNHRAHSNRAEALRLLGRFADALAGIENALDVVVTTNEPESFHVEYTWQRGRILHHLGRFDEAVAAHTSAVAREPDNPTYRHDLAVAHLELEQWAEAAEHFEAIHVLQPDHFATISRLGAIYQRSGDYARAERFLRLAMEQAPTIEEQFLVAARLIRVLTTAPDPQVRNLDEALFMATRMADLTQRRDPGILSMLASVLHEAGERDEAIAVAREGLVIARSLGLREVEAPLIEQLRAYE